MTLANGPRPREVHIFALIFIAVGLWNLLQALTDIDSARAMLSSFLDREVSRDEAIILVSARFTIVLIPVAAIWLFASRIARIVVTVMAIAASWQLLGQFAALQSGLGFDRFVVASILAGLLGAAYLYTAPSRHWFKEGAHGHAKAFD